MPGKRREFDKEVRTGSAGGVSSTFADDPVDGFGYPEPDDARCSKSISSAIAALTRW